jgi:hypothetical protein
MTEQTTETVPLTVRMEASLRRQLEEAAKAARRSVSSESAYRLEASFRRQANEAA